MPPYSENFGAKKPSKEEIDEQKKWVEEQNKKEWSGPPKSDALAEATVDALNNLDLDNNDKSVQSESTDRNETDFRYLENLSFHNLPFSFDHNGQIIHGIINGSIFDWEFKSEDPLFLQYISSGLLSRKSTFYSLDEQREEFINNFYKVLDEFVI